MCVDIVRRLKMYMEHVGLPSTQFADYAKIARPTISQLLNGRNRKVSNELIAKLHEAFPDLNILWLMFGDGEMEIKQKSTAEHLYQPTLFGEAMSDKKRAVNTTANSARPTAPQLAEQMQEPSQAQESAQPQTIQIPVTQSSGTQKRIQTIMVCYTDNSFEIFTPAY